MWVAFAAAVGGLGLLALVAGLPLTVVASVALAGVVLLARVVPDLVIDVDDDVLLDIGRLSVTSWSPREARRPRRRGWRIDDEAVASVVAAASVEQVATLVGLAVVSLGASATLGVQLAHPVGARASPSPCSWRRRRPRSPSPPGPTGADATARCCGQPPSRRPSRSREPPCSGPAPPARSSVAAAAVVLALVLSAVALALGRGYRSLWASRLADVLELLTLVAVLPLALWAAGLVERSMGLFA